MHPHFHFALQTAACKTSVFTLGKTEDREQRAQRPDEEGNITLLSFITDMREDTDVQ